MNEVENEEIKLEWLLITKKLNQFTKIDNYFLPNKEVLINLVKNRKYFSNFNFKYEFWQMKMKEDSISYIGFSTP